MYQWQDHPAACLWQRGGMPKLDPTEIERNSRRESYSDAPNRIVPVYAPVKPAPREKTDGSLLSVRAEERFGSLLAAAGTIWAVYVATSDYNNLWHMQIMRPGPVEVGLLGLLLWLHGKWRRSIKG